ncbi:hypothetical protein F4777DRAFT_20625 [Nemania sp. FL0916]|nr:hypothetical protein F4777DRAFT_20625 [Nemania sp. FL0916]
MNPAWPAWECRDQIDRAEVWYNQPLRDKNRSLENENLFLKGLLRKNGISWQPSKSKPARAKSSRVTRSSTAQNRRLPFLPVEIQLKILKYAMTGRHPIVDPLCKSTPGRMLKREKNKQNDIAIHFLATCRAYRYEGTRLLWRNNTFVFTSPDCLQQFANLDPRHRKNIRHVTFRVIARLYDDENRVHKMSPSHHPSLRGPTNMFVQRRPKEKTLARRGFRAYAWYQLVDFLEAMLPPYDPTVKYAPTDPRPRLLPGLESLRLDFVSFAEALLQYPPQILHDLASHRLGCMLNEITVTGLPTDECGVRVGSELSGLLKDGGLLNDHGPTLLARKDGVEELPCVKPQCGHLSRVVRAMPSAPEHILRPYHGYPALNRFPPAPPVEERPPYSEFHSCRTIWKKVPIDMVENSERKWVLFDRISGLPWDEIEEEATLFDFMEEDVNPMVCQNCGECHPGALLPEELMELWDNAEWD